MISDPPEYLTQVSSELTRVKAERDHYRKALEEVALSNRTKSSMRQAARKALYDREETR